MSPTESSSAVASYMYTDPEHSYLQWHNIESMLRIGIMSENGLMRDIQLVYFSFGTRNGSSVWSQQLLGWNCWKQSMSRSSLRDRSWVVLRNCKEDEPRWNGMISCQQIVPLWSLLGSWSKEITPVSSGIRPCTSAFNAQSTGACLMIISVSWWARYSPTRDISNYLMRWHSSQLHDACTTLLSHLE